MIGTHIDVPEVQRLLAQGAMPGISTVLTSRVLHWLRSAGVSE